MKTSDLLILGAGAYVLWGMQGGLAGIVGKNVGQAVNQKVQEQIHIVKASLPQANVYVQPRPSQTLPVIYTSYTPALTGPLSSTKIDDWRCVLL